MQKFDRVAGLLFTALPLAAIPAGPAAAAPQATTRQQAIAFERFFAAFRTAVLAGDRAKVAGMVALPFQDFSGGEVDRSAKTRAEFLAHYDRIFTPAVIAGLRAGKTRAYAAATDGGEAPGPIQAGEYLLNLPEFGDQLVFSPRGGSYVLSRTPFYS